MGVGVYVQILGDESCVDGFGLFWVRSRRPQCGRAADHSDRGAVLPALQLHRLRRVFK